MADRVSRVLHIVESLDNGAVENWLLRMLRHAKERDVPVDWTFYCQLKAPGRHEQIARQLGATVVHSPVPIHDKLRFARALRRELKCGAYDVVHTHHDLISGMYLAAAVGLPVGLRIVHVHNADEQVLTSHRVKQAIMRPVLRYLCLRMADRIVGISNHTLDTFIENRPRDAQRHMVLYYGVDPLPFRTTMADRGAFRNDLSLPSSSELLLYVGRMVHEKNPIFAVEVLAALRNLKRNTYLILVGGGPLIEQLVHHAERLGMTPFIRVLGWCDDVAAIMRCCDLFIHPRLEDRGSKTPTEGLGLAIVEAQLAGMRLLLSQAVPDDALFANSVVKKISLQHGPLAWASAAATLLTARATSIDKALLAHDASPFNMDFALSQLSRLHQGLMLGSSADSFGLLPVANGGPP